MTSTVLLIEDALDNRHIARAVYKPCGVPTRGVNVSRLMAADVKEVLCRAELTKEDFLLLMLSPMGKQALEEYGNIVAVDGSGGTTVYKHMQMIAFVVANAGRSTVVAVAYVLSEREDVYAAVFAVLKLWAPKWLLRGVQSDLAFAPFNAATLLQERHKLWGEGVVIRWFFCLWHLKRAVRAQLIQLLARPKHGLEAKWGKVRTAIYQHVMRIIGDRRDKHGFRNLRHANLAEMECDIAVLRRLLITYRQFEALQYLNTYLSARTAGASRTGPPSRGSSSRWCTARTRCARRHVPTGCTPSTFPASSLVVNMYLDAFLKIIKHLVLKGRQGNRLDTSRATWSAPSNATS